jgi:hypothetical protein
MAQIEPQDEKPFVDFISTMVCESMRDYIRLIEALR